MRLANTTAAILLGILLLINIFSFLNINKRFVSFINSSLEQQATLCGNYMESQLEGFENDMNRLLYNYDFATIFINDKVFNESESSLQVFYAKYRNLITNIYVYDNNKNYFGLYINDADKFVVDTFPRQRQQQLTSRVRVEEEAGSYLYHFPFFMNDRVSGNLIVEVDLEDFSQSTFSFYPIGKTITWQWMLNSESRIITSNFPENIEVESVDILADSIDMFSSGLIKHNILDSNGKKRMVHSAYYPLSVFGKNLGIVFSASQNDFYKFFISQNLLITFLTFLLSVALVVYLLLIIGKRSGLQNKLMMSEIVFRQTIERFPVGIMILDSENIIKNINSAAKRMLFIGDKEDLIGKEYTHQHILSNRYLLKDSTDTLDPTDYLYYEREGIETVIFRVQETASIGGEEMRLFAYIDVSPLERSRKQEVAANRAKSDFLAAMSHEIRTPMNGILGMVTSLMNSKLPGGQKEKVEVIKKSTDLLMTIINDILDYSKIEAGKMLLEEIPYLLRDEITIVTELFKPLAEEKGLIIETDVKPTVPNRLIGDPFRLRQVISNLVSNAVKFSEQGKIVIGAEVTENYNNRYQLHIWVEDSGIGIPADRIPEIFGSYSQTSISASRKFEGTGLGTTIAKQLVELMNGEIWVSSPSRLSISETYPGSCFNFTIESYSNEKIVKEYDFSSVQNLSQITTLFITKEPNPERNTINKIINNFGINIVTKIYQESSIDTVLHHISVKKDLYQMLIIADKLDLEGFTLANRLQEEGIINLLPVLMVTNNDQPGNYKICKKLGVDYYLIEPFENKEIFDVIVEVFPGLKDRAGIEPTLSALPQELSILLVEDNIINQKVAQTIFKNIGYEIEIASNGLEAVNLTSQKEYDIIFMDLFMPEVDGFDATRTIRKAGVKTPIIAMSADVDDERKVNAAEAGMDSFLPKPAKLETIKQLLIKRFSTQIT